MSDVICNQDITFIEKLFKEHPDQQRIREHYRTVYDKVQNEWLPDDKWIHLVSIFRGYLGIVTYPDLPEGTPVILPDETGEDSLLLTVLRLPGAFVPREGSTFPPPSPESSLSDSVYEHLVPEVPDSSEEGMSDSVSGDQKSVIPAVMSSVAVEKGWDEVAKLFYDGTTLIEAYLTRFDFFVKRLL